MQQLLKIHNLFPRLCDYHTQNMIDPSFDLKGQKIALLHMNKLDISGAAMFDSFNDEIYELNPRAANVDERLSQSGVRLMIIHKKGDDGSFVHTPSMNILSIDRDKISSMHVKWICHHKWMNLGELMEVHQKKKEKQQANK